MRYLVTGGAGFIGSHVAELLAEEPYADVIVLDDLSTGKRANVPEGCVLIRGDVRDALTVRQVMAEVDVVFHEAAFVSIRGSFDRPRDDLATNALGALTVFEEAARAGVRKVIFASSMAVYGEPQSAFVSENDPAAPNSPYGLSKLRGEMMLRTLAGKHGFEWVALRYFNTWGPRQAPSDYVGVLTTFIRQALLGQALTVHGDGKQTRDFVHVTDVARANLLARRPGVSGVFNIGSGTELSVVELAQRVIGIVGGEIVHQPEPPGEISRIRADVSRARECLSYEPHGSLDLYLSGLVDTWRRRLRAEGLGDRLVTDRPHRSVA